MFAKHNLDQKISHTMLNKTAYLFIHYLIYLFCYSISSSIDKINTKLKQRNGKLKNLYTICDISLQF